MLLLFAGYNKAAEIVARLLCRLFYFLRNESTATDTRSFSVGGIQFTSIGGRSVYFLTFKCEFFVIGSTCLQVIVKTFCIELVGDRSEL